MMSTAKRHRERSSREQLAKNVTSERSKAQ
jgi:hypothetical protein